MPLRLELVTRNVAVLASVPRIERPAIAALTLADAHKILEASAGSRFEAIYALALSTGARRGELSALQDRYRSRTGATQYHEVLAANRWTSGSQ